MARPSTVSRLFPGLHSGGRRRVAQPRAGGWSLSGRTSGHSCGSRHAGWHPSLANVVGGVSGCDLPGEDLGWSLPRADATEAVWGQKARLAAGATGGLADPHHRWVHPVSWRVGPLGYRLPGFGSVCLATSSEFTTGSRGLIKGSNAESDHGHHLLNSHGASPLFGAFWVRHDAAVHKAACGGEYYAKKTQLGRNLTERAARANEPASHCIGPRWHS